jgi:hypothetical protein
MVPVFHHNLLDVITMGEILNALCVPAAGRRTASQGGAGGVRTRADRPLTWP